MPAEIIKEMQDTVDWMAKAQRNQMEFFIKNHHKGSLLMSPEEKAFTIVQATGCHIDTAKFALEKREGNVTFAIEYINHHAMTVEQRYPLWSAYLKEKQNGSDRGSNKPT